MLEQLGKQAKEASVILANAGITEKNEALKMASQMSGRQPELHFD